ncbi:hypothetical protein BJ508DRAFT_364795 [Ascobolus immersus RN42]|uniref:Uncharacterized protein n=1 Tax=Ascobolus immersus RN42 TaxID=1160509 RepID=A0A3N4HUH7_ASCIM|nr:hypothetical protein BJ508DRAFT_364795 [Ascobolus immersus RN42]
MRHCPLSRPDNLVLRLGEVFTPARTAEALAAREKRLEKEREEAAKKARREQELLAQGITPKKRGRPPGKKRKVEETCARCGEGYERNGVEACSVPHRSKIEECECVDVGTQTGESRWKWKCCGRGFAVKGYRQLREGDGGEGGCYRGPHTWGEGWGWDGEVEKQKYQALLQQQQQAATSTTNGVAMANGTGPSAGKPEVPLGPDGQPIKRGRGRPKGSKTKRKISVPPPAPPPTDPFAGVSPTTNSEPTQVAVPTSTTTAAGATTATSNAAQQPSQQSTGQTRPPTASNPRSSTDETFSSLRHVRLRIRLCLATPRRHNHNNPLHIRPRTHTRNR